jgi:hypothetical protein
MTTMSETNPRPPVTPAVGMRTEKLTRIMLEESDAVPPNGQPFGLNGRNWLLRAGEEAEVPPGILEVLNHAVMSVPVLDPLTKKISGYRDRLRFPYRIIKADGLRD